MLLLASDCKCCALIADDYYRTWGTDDPNGSDLWAQLLLDAVPGPLGAGIDLIDWIQAPILAYIELVVRTQWCSAGKRVC